MACSWYRNTGTAPAGENVCSEREQPYGTQRLFSCLLAVMGTLLFFVALCCVPSTPPIRPRVVLCVYLCTSGCSRAPFSTERKCRKKGRRPCGDTTLCAAYNCEQEGHNRVRGIRAVWVWTVRRYRRATLLPAALATDAPCTTTTTSLAWDVTVAVVQALHTIFIFMLFTCSCNLYIAGCQALWRAPGQR